MEWPRIDGHTPGPFTILGGTGGMVYTSGSPYGHGAMHYADVRGWGHLSGVGACNFKEAKAARIHDANARLLTLIGPHLCDVPDCPGPRLVARLEAAAKWERCLYLIANADPDAPEVESWKWLARKFMADAREAISAHESASEPVKEK